ncbi:hypothetical protein D918_07551 [Trichuris suis]|nr:hypothetical protein D918_07551 [Trichuris suis]
MFEWPDENQIPADIRAITRVNGVRWVHEYQEACVDKLEKFINGELNVNRGFFPLPQFGSYSRSMFVNSSPTTMNVSGSSSTDMGMFNSPFLSPVKCANGSNIRSDRKPGKV